MRFPQQLILLGALFGSSVLTLFGVIITAEASPAIYANAPVEAEIQEIPQTDSGTTISPGESPTISEPPAPQDEIAQTSEQTSSCLVSDSFPDSILQWCELITSYAEQHKVEPNLVASMMLQESGGDPLAYSASGAVGLMQVMPRDGLAANFWCANGPCFSSRPTIDELQDPAFNIEYGTRMISGLIDRTGSVRDALKSYGPKDVDYYYADKVLAIYENHQ